MNGKCLNYETGEIRFNSVNLKKKNNKKTFSTKLLTLHDGDDVQFHSYQ